jgi:hypothetical protein
MNIALSAVITFILLLPPIAFYLSLTFGRFAKAGPKLGLLEGLMLSAIFSVVLHAIAIQLMPGEIRFDILALLLGGELKTFSATVANDAFKSMFRTFVLYNSLLLLASIVLGLIVRWVIERTGLHARSELLRLYNQWWYLFQGYKIDGFINQSGPPPFDVVFVDALVNTNAGTMIYSGYLIDFVCEGEALNRIYLSETSKREFKQNSMNDRGNVLINEPGEPSAIDGDTMMIPYAQIINMNLHFITLPSELGDIPEDAEIRIQEEL